MTPVSADGGANEGGRLCGGEFGVSREREEEMGHDEALDERSNGGYDLGVIAGEE